MPCGIPNKWTYSGISFRYFNGVAMKSNNTYEIPSSRAMIRKIESKFIVQICANIIFVLLCRPATNKIIPKQNATVLQILFKLLS